MRKLNDRRYKKLRLLLEDRNIKHQQVAKDIGMAPARFSQKINRNKSDFTLAEASRVCDVLDISLDEYFYVQDFSKMRKEAIKT
ncbi:helix-turn-helix transcriptional regulator [Staphylococcus chromogenes]|nr:helix-turn-helix transcriptional regulator [Staphylococcus chromogenes]MDU0476317.1 helix-turn-helix transcriptional regulator [Staphylococcus chromogenes]